MKRTVPYRLLKKHKQKTKRMVITLEKGLHFWLKLFSMWVCATRRYNSGINCNFREELKCTVRQPLGATYTKLRYF